MSNSNDCSKIRPFYCGGQFGDWTGANCDRCTKGSHKQHPDELPKCELEAALVEAYVTDGQIDKIIAERIGFDPNKYNWNCTEWEPTPEWETEWKKRHESTS